MSGGGGINFAELEKRQASMLYSLAVLLIIVSKIYYKSEN